MVFVQNFVFLWCNLWNKISSFITPTSTKAKKKGCDSPDPKYYFLPNPMTSHPPTTKAPSKNNWLTKSGLLPFPNRFFTQTLQYQNLKSNKYYILIKLGPPVSEFSTKISYFYAPTDSEQKFHKTGVKNWLPIGFGLGLPLIGYLLL